MAALTEFLAHNDKKCHLDREMFNVLLQFVGVQINHVNFKDTMVNLLYCNWSPLFFTRCKHNKLKCPAKPSYNFL